VLFIYFKIYDERLLKTDDVTCDKILQETIFLFLCL